MGGAVGPGPGPDRLSLLFQVDVRSVQRHPETPVNVAGFHFPSKVKRCRLGGRGSAALTCLSLLFLRNLLTPAAAQQGASRPGRRSSAACGSGGIRCPGWTSSSWLCW